MVFPLKMTLANQTLGIVFNGKLIKGSKAAIQRHIEAYLIAKQKAEQQQKK